MLDTKTKPVNGLDLDLIGGIVDDIGRDAGNAKLSFAVTTRWKGGTRSETEVGDIVFGGERLARNYRIAADEPVEIAGTDTAPNPQELLMAALNACMLVGYVAGASMKGITLDRLEIETHGTLDLRGFLGLDESVPPGYEHVDYTVRIAGNGSAADFQEIHQGVMKTSPNYFNLGRPIRLNGTLVTA